MILKTVEMSPIKKWAIYSTLIQSHVACLRGYGLAEQKHLLFKGVMGKGRHNLILGETLTWGIINMVDITL